MMIHAGFLDNRMWDREFKSYSKNNMVIRYDVRGYGKSTRPSAEYSDHEDLFTLLKHLGVRKAVLLGVSNGGRIAFDFISLHPEMVGGLILISPGIRGYQSSGPEEDKAWDDLDRREGEQDRATKEGRIDGAVGIDLEIWAPVSRHGPWAEQIARIAGENSHIHKEPPNRLQRSPQPPPFLKLGSIRVPVLLVVGDRDVEGMRTMTKRLHDLIPGSRFVVIEGADHIANMSRPNELDALVTHYLDGMR